MLLLKEQVFQASHPDDQAWAMATGRSGEECFGGGIETGSNIVKVRVQNDVAD